VILPLHVATTILHVQTFLLRLPPAYHVGRFDRFLEVGADIAAELAVIVKILALELGALLVGSGSHVKLPFASHFLNLLLVVKVGIVVLADATNALPERQMLRVDRDTVILMLASSSNVRPTTLLLLKIEARRVWKEDNGQDHTGQTKPWYNVKFGLSADVVVQNRRGESAKLATGRRETVCSGSNGSWIDFCCYEEGDRVGSELVEKRKYIAWKALMCAALL
jgi:hypothetical protein